MKKLLLAAVLATCGVVSLPARAGEVSGRVWVAGRPADAQVTTIVYAEPLERKAPVTPRRTKLLQQNKSFQPRVQAVPVGSTVDFVNEDGIYHNVFSLSPPEPFDLGLYSARATRSRKFKQAGTYRVFCNIHPDMVAVILVVPTSFITEADRAGNYRLDLPPGRYRITAWSERAQPATAEVTVTQGSAAAPDLSLDESQFVELPHKNKYGRDYANIKWDEPPAKKPK
jgi:plastocyanin